MATTDFAPIETDESKNMTLQYLLSLRHNEEEVGFILKGHLIIEYVLNQIIRKKFKSYSTILDDSRSYTFSVKLQMIYSTGYLPAYLFLNIKRINHLRNHLAHNLTPVIKENQFKFIGPDGKEILVKKPKHSHYPARHYCKILCVGTLAQLREHFASEFGEWPVHPDIK